ncbi:transmembrane protein, putative [Bodo saltans]|uniref:Transmembrane protein, putative n=1 Tax=Bodo saltans TaxID=75058 RepID=A0A0S4JQG0_BODSA|nr:transmembrane protein, putative [Bodo saltans]|eukprot:CUG92774.1 transmembrane protein, putative [Bodo saltans]
MHTFTRTISPVVDEEDSMTGVVCDNLNPHLIIYIAASLVTLVLILYCRHRSASPPSFVLGKSTPDFGLPFKIAAIMYNVCLWSLVPQITLFLVFHVLTTDVFPLQTNCACIVITNLPIFPFLMLVQGTLMLALLPRPNSIRKDFGDVLIPANASTATKKKKDLSFSLNSETASPHVVNDYDAVSYQNAVLPSRQKVLLLGCTSHGALLIDALVKEQCGDSNTEVHMVDYASHLSHEEAFVQYNASCLGVSGEDVASRFHSSLSYDGNHFILPFANDTFDRVIVSPGLRNSIAIGDMFATEDEKIERMTCVVREGMRVLCEGGEMNAYDDVYTVMRLWADLRDAGFEATVEDANATSEPIFKIKMKMFHLSAFRHTPLDTSVNSVTCRQNTSQSLLDATPLMIADAQGTTTLNTSTNLSYTTRWTLAVSLQLMIFVSLLAGMLALYSPLSIPEDIPFDVRLGNPLRLIVMGYPIIAYISRHFRLLSLHCYQSIWEFACACVRAELLVLALWNIRKRYVWFPGFLLQMPLKDTSLSGSTCTLLGLVVPIPLGFAKAYFGKRFHRSVNYSSRGLPETYQCFLP